MTEKFYCVGCKQHYELEVHAAQRQPSKVGSFRHSLISECPKGHRVNKLCKKERYESQRGLTYGVAMGIAGPRAYVQVRINTTDYFLDPDNVPNDGIPGTSSPYPRSIDFQPSFNLYPDVYVLPGQVWDVLVTFFNTQAFAGATAAAGELRCFVKYTLYDGPDALIANKLLEMGISINPGNVDWYKRSLLASQ
mgnify:CR=1 FL=1